MIRVAVLISGGGSNMVSLVDSMDDAHPGTTALVLSNKPDAGGLTKAADRGIPTAVINHRDYATREAFEDALHQTLVDHQIDVVCLAGFMRILTAGFTSKWEGRMLNIHPSLLPKYKGLHTHARAIDAGDAIHGCTVHLVTAALDDGPILGQAQVPILRDDNPESLASRVLAQEHVLYPAVLQEFLSQQADDLVSNRAHAP